MFLLPYSQRGALFWQGLESKNTIMFYDSMILPGLYTSSLDYIENYDMISSRTKFDLSVEQHRL